MTADEQDPMPQTPEEAAACIVNGMSWGAAYTIMRGEVERRIAAMIGAMLAAEREACARLAESDQFCRHFYDAAYEDNADIAAAIRARGATPPAEPLA